MANAAAPQSGADAFAAALATAEPKEASPTYAQMAKSVHLLADLALGERNEDDGTVTPLTEAMHERLRTRTGVSALIDMLS